MREIGQAETEHSRALYPTTLSPQSGSHRASTRDKQAEMTGGVTFNITAHPQPKITYTGVYRAYLKSWLR